MKKLVTLFLVVTLLATLSVSAYAAEEEIVIWRPQQTAQIEAWLETMLDAFNTKYAGQYKAVQQSFPKSGADSYSDKVNTAVISNMLPDVLFVDGPNVAGYAENGIITSLDPYVTADDKADMLKSCLDQGSYKDELYSIALWESSVGIFYNKDMLAEAGIEAPAKLEDAWTWSELFDVAQKLKADGRFGITLNTNASQITYYYSPLFVQLGSDMISADGSTASGYVNSEAGVKVASFLKRFYDEGVANIEPVSTEFAEGHSAMWLATSYQITTLASYPDLNWGVTYYPVSDERVGGTPTGSWTVAMSNNAKNKDATYLLIDFLTNSEANISGSPASGYLPARHSSADALTQYNEEPYRVFVEQLGTNGTPRPRTPVFTTLNASFNSALSDIVLGSDPQTKLDEIAQTIDAEYQMNYAN